MDNIQKRRSSSLERKNRTWIFSRARFESFSLKIVRTFDGASGRHRRAADVESAQQKRPRPEKIRRASETRFVSRNGQVQISSTGGQDCGAVQNCAADANGFRYFETEVNVLRVVVQIHEALAGMQILTW